MPGKAAAAPQTTLAEAAGAAVLSAPMSARSLDRARVRVSTPPRMSCVASNSLVPSAQVVGLLRAFAFVLCRLNLREVVTRASC